MQNKRWRYRIRREEVWLIITELVEHQCCTEEFHFTLNTLTKHTHMLLHKQAINSHSSLTHRSFQRWLSSSSSIYYLTSIICSCMSNSVSYATQAVVKTQAINETHFWSKEEGSFSLNIRRNEKSNMGVCILCL